MKTSRRGFWKAMLGMGAVACTGAPPLVDPKASWDRISPPQDEEDTVLFTAVRRGKDLAWRATKVLHSFRPLR